MAILYDVCFIMTCKCVVSNSQSPFFFFLYSKVNQDTNYISTTFRDDLIPCKKLALVTAFRNSYKIVKYDWVFSNEAIAKWPVTVHIEYRGIILIVHFFCRKVTFVSFHIYGNLPFNSKLYFAIKVYLT